VRIGQRRGLVIALLAALAYLAIILVSRYH
jgi:hypothetical protein